MVSEQDRDEDGETHRERQTDRQSSKTEREEEVVFEDPHASPTAPRVPAPPLDSAPPWLLRSAPCPKEAERPEGTPACGGPTPPPRGAWPAHGVAPPAQSRAGRGAATSIHTPPAHEAPAISGEF